ncbi:MAG TPA: Sir2 family NAD-dependent protein deacetylase [Bacteroidales bacterium]|nr:Sir2 family NAD-dependent protein deacetylase [Bacteroidales bacterium]
MRKHIVVFTGAGVSAESGIPTFRDKHGIWEKFNVEEVATSIAWRNNPKKVLDFHNIAKLEMEKCKPNTAHLNIAELERKYDVTVVTQNIDTLHEEAGSTKVRHIHGRIDQAVSTFDKNLTYDLMRGETLEIGDLCELGHQKKFNTVLFGDQLPIDEVTKSVNAIEDADILIVIGCSLAVQPAASFIDKFCGESMYIINPAEQEQTYVFMDYEHKYQDATYIQKVATLGMKQLMNLL